MSTEYDTAFLLHKAVLFDMEQKTQDPHFNRKHLGFIKLKLEQIYKRK